jgi:hypothetical protein
MAARWDGCPCRGARVLRPAIDLHAQLSPAQRGHFFPCPSNPIAPRWLLPSARLAPTVARRCRSPIGRRAATTSSLDRRAPHPTPTAPWSAAAATPTRVLYRWGNGLHAYHELETLAPIMWQRSPGAGYMRNRSSRLPVGLRLRAPTHAAGPAVPAHLGSWRGTTLPLSIGSRHAKACLSPASEALRGDDFPAHQCAELRRRIPR